ncbi:hypothetical protein OG830_02515 [Streptomyces sp. NBC_00121]|uniref:hypothetical protein n=1 Tax=unclassified Streptomyces TaxID=2593676 RepID=UPI0028C4F28C|nr:MULTISPECIES: hypothetical protein [unclassified Streptomyces]WNO62828.1 hypothetical protein RPQ02_02930 [Streptomyces sp. AM2-3-1]WSC67409.1 hypothetical protein OG807_02530 [Streptomyces sp. NBC_01760]WTI85294.1 hypothetical protein OHB17_03110 [Streptomyces sp. NBC_00724]
MADATEWHDPATGYRRRQITGPRFPADIAECRYAAILTRVEGRGISCIRPASPVPRPPQLLHQLQKPRHIP